MLEVCSKCHCRQGICLCPPPIEYIGVGTNEDLRAQLAAAQERERLANAKLRTLGDITLCATCNGTGNLNGSGCCSRGHARECQCFSCTWIRSWYAQNAELRVANERAEAMTSAWKIAHERYAEQQELIEALQQQAEASEKQAAGLEAGMKDALNPAHASWKHWRQWLGDALNNHAGALAAHDAALVEPLNRRIAELEAAILAHRNQKEDDRCWLDDHTLYLTLGDNPHEPIQADLPPRDVFLSNCARYWECRKTGTTYERPEDLVLLLAGAKREGAAEALEHFAATCPAWGDEWRGKARVEAAKLREGKPNA